MRNLTSFTSLWNRTTLLIASLICFFIINSAIAVFGQQRQTLSPEDAKLWREDLRFLAEELPKRHANLFHTMTREQFETAVKQLDERIPTLQLKNDPLYAYADLYFVLRLPGRRMQNRQRYDEAIKIFELNISEHPRSDEAQILLGDLYWITQRKEQAIKYYERAMEFNPSNWRIADLLRNWRRDRIQPSVKK